MTTPILEQARLYAIIDTGYLGDRPVEFYARELVAGGADIVQLRAKGLPAERVIEMGRAILPILRDGGVPLIINDDPVAAGSVGAAGAHVGQDDMPVRDARRLAAWRVAPQSIVGKSTHSPQQAFAAAEEGADYIGFGPLFATPTKPDYPAIGLCDVARVTAGAGLPVFCIGGVKIENLRDVLKAGARRVVVVSGILKAGRPSEYCRALKEILLEVG
ncbi:MAG TPA: thiamine phosphate synthase [Verrucomicrobiae bacterium]|nr:thiamine phosphate synthase [Verrucomicrobiae bacterium]